MLIKHELILRDELAKPAYAEDIAAQAWQAIADTLNARASVANPETQPTRPKLLDWTTFMGLLATADVLKLYSYGQLAADLRAALEANNRTVTLAIWRGLKTALTAPSVTAVETEAAKTELDPTWTATVLAPSIAMTLGIPAPTAEDVQFVVFRYRGE